MSDITAKMTDCSPIQKKDILKDTPLRGLGYMDDIGAASRPLVSGAKSGLLRAFPGVAYIPATVYMAANVVDKFHKGVDGTGKKPSFKAGLREALYQGVVNILAPIGIVAGVSKASSKITGKVPELITKLPDNAKKAASKVLNTVKETKLGEKLVKNKGMIGNAAIFGLSVLALAKLSKPVDKLTDKIFNKTVDPILKLNKPEAKKEAETVEE